MRLLSLVALLIGFLLLIEPVAAQGLPFTSVPLDDMRAFRPAASNWQIAGAVYADRTTHHALTSEPGTGVLVNHPSTSARDNLFTAFEHGDLELELDVMIPKGSNSGLYLQGRYELQLLDSWGVEYPHYSDMGGIYQRWDEARGAGQEGYEGHPPRQNAARAPGLWQHLHILFHAPRFDAEGRKTANARFVKVELNGVVLHENVEVTGPTRGPAFADEQPLGPLMIQGDHGPLAFRNIRYKRYNDQHVNLADLQYRTFEGVFEDIPDVSGMSPSQEGAMDGLQWNLDGVEDQFTRVIEGQVEIPASGEYAFDLSLSWVTGDPHFQGRKIGGGVLEIGGQEVLQHPGVEQTASATATLEAGSQPLRLTYYKNRGWAAPRLALYAEGPGVPRQELNAPGTLSGRGPFAPLSVEPEGEVRLLRSFVMHGGAKRTRALSVGDPTGVHYTVDLDTGALLYAWRGPFLDTGAMWRSRGESQLAQPTGSVIMLPGTPVLTGAAQPLALQGYVLDEAGRPTIEYEMGGVHIYDLVQPDPTGTYLTRMLHFEAADAPTDLSVQLTAGSAIEQLPDGSFAVDDRTYYIEAEDASPQIREVEEGEELVLPVHFEEGVATVRYAIIW